jgi:hypothetical protein
MAGVYRHQSLGLSLLVVFSTEQIVSPSCRFGRETSAKINILPEHIPTDTNPVDLRNADYIKSEPIADNLH